MPIKNAAQTSHVSGPYIVQTVDYTELQDLLNELCRTHHIVQIQYEPAMGYRGESYTVIAKQRNPPNRGPI